MLYLRHIAGSIADNRGILRGQLIELPILCENDRNRDIYAGQLRYDGGEHMKNSQSKEDYLESILLLSKELEDVHQIEVARRMGVSQPAVQKAIRLLRQDGYITADGLHICLTEEGLRYAEEVYEKHCTIKRFLELHGVNKEDADADACKLEHALSPASYDVMKKFVDEHGG